MIHNIHCWPAAARCGGTGDGRRDVSILSDSRTDVEREDDERARERELHVGIDCDQIRASGRARNQRGWESSAHDVRLHVLLG